MLGTTTVSTEYPVINREWGNTCDRFLSAVQGHASKASRTYYSRYFRQYFAGAYASLSEIRRVLKPGGQCILVVQDSFYKDLHNNLPQMFFEMGALLGLRPQHQIPFVVKRTFAGVNPAVKPYREESKATEVILIFRKEEAT
jgi:ubiquinone/menaquinone biosynthesis C-methylase UbiE